MKRYRLSLEAQSDLIDIKTYLVEAGGARLARYVLGEIRRGLQMLAENPGAGHVRDDLTDEPVKFWPVFSYLIIYDPMMQPLSIASVLHACQDLEILFKIRPPRARSVRLALAATPPAEPARTASRLGARGGGCASLRAA